MTHPVKSVRSAALALAVYLVAIPLGALATDTPTANLPSERHYPHLSDNAWINDIGTLLSDDPDGDGYFSGLSLSIDADSGYNRYGVYVIIDIVDELNVAERFHTSQVFDVYGRSISDDYRIDIDLVQNYSPGVYDLQVILVDAHDDRILDRVSDNDFRNLRSLPLESRDNQTVHTPVPDRPISAPNDDIVVSEYAGGTGTGFLLLLITSGVSRALRARLQQARTS